MAHVPNICDGPLPLDDFSAQHQRHVDPSAPLPLREMGAKGLIPGVAPGDLVKVLYNLQFDTDCAAFVGESMRELPQVVRVSVVSGSLPPKVLDFCARQWLSDGLIAERILRHRDVADETVAFVAGKCDALLADVVAENQVRFVRYPKIVEELYVNPSVHQSTVDRVVEFVRRQGVELSGLPGLQAALNAGLEIASEPVPEEVPQAQDRDVAFASILQNSALGAEREEREGVTMRHVEAKVTEFGDLLDQAMSQMSNAASEGFGFGDDDHDNLEAYEEESRYISKQVLIARMRISEKVRMATIGGKEERMLLLKDSNRLVYMAALQSPKMQIDDLKALAGNKGMPTDVIVFISNRRELLRDYSVVKALVNNPKTALRTGVRLLNYLRDSDVKQIARSRQVSPQLVRMAKNRLRQKETKAKKK